MPRELEPPSTRERLLELLREGRALTYEDITEALPVDTTRHARRLVSGLRGRGVDIQERRRRRKKEFYLPASGLRVEGSPVPLTGKQAHSLLVAAEAGRAMLRPTPLSGPLEEAFQRLKKRLEQSTTPYNLERLSEQWHFGREPSSSTFDPDVFDALVEALNRSCAAEITYESPSASSDAPRRRKISPLVMAAPGGSWRCVAYCHFREAPRDFTVSRIEDATLLKAEAATRPEDFDPELYFRDRFRALGGEPAVVRLLVEAGRAHYFQEKDYHPTQVIEEKREDGRLVVSFEVGGLEDIASWIRSWGPEVKVLGPEKLARRIRSDAKETLRRYET